jgi:hypothetical protein
LSAETNWELTKTLLTARIRRRYVALQRLTNAPTDADAIDHEIETCGDDTKALWALAERIDRALDNAMAPNSSRTPIPDKPAVKTNNDFRSR